MVRLWLICAAFALAACAPSARAEPFEQLRAAYAARDARAAALAYAPDAEIVYRYAGVPEERHVGRIAIEASFAAFFAQLDPSVPPDLRFRITHLDGSRRTGFYRLGLGVGTTVYGAFDVELSADGLFVRDVSTDAAMADFEPATEMERPGAAAAGGD